MSEPWRSNTWLSGLVVKHSTAGILLDSNLLLVYYVGVLDPRLVSREKGTREYTGADFKFLAAFLRQFSCVVTTPNIMTEVSNLAGKLRQDIGLLFHRFVRERLIEVVDERYVPTQDSATDAVFDRLGVADATISTLASRGVLVLTNDLDLRIMLESRQVDCIHYDRDLRPLVLSLE